jgi:hypothetical protein
LIVVIIATATLLMIAHLAEVLVWSLTYTTFGVAPVRLILRPECTDFQLASVS